MHRSILLFLGILAGCQNWPFMTCDNAIVPTQAASSSVKTAETPPETAQSDQIHPPKVSPTPENIQNKSVSIPKLSKAKPVRPVDKHTGSQMLQEGIKTYGEGNYVQSAHLLQNALNLGLPKKNERIQANKYLAFIACAKNEQGACRYHFRQILLINPKFELSTNEAGHPLWGPVFKEIKAQKKLRK